MTARSQADRARAYRERHRSATASGSPTHEPEDLGTQLLRAMAEQNAKLVEAVTGFVTAVTAFVTSRDGFRDERDVTDAPRARAPGKNISLSSSEDTETKTTEIIARERDVTDRHENRHVTRHAPSSLPPVQRLIDPKLKLTEEARNLALDRGVQDVDGAFLAFVGHHVAKGTLSCDFLGGNWPKWLPMTIRIERKNREADRNEPGRSNGNGSHSNPNPTTRDQVIPRAEIDQKLRDAKAADAHARRHNP